MNVAVGVGGGVTVQVRDMDVVGVRVPVGGGVTLRESVSEVLADGLGVGARDTVAVTDRVQLGVRRDRDGDTDAETERV